MLLTRRHKISLNDTFNHGDNLAEVVDDVHDESAILPAALTHAHSRFYHHTTNTVANLPAETTGLYQTSYWDHTCELAGGKIHNIVQRSLNEQICENPRYKFDNETINVNNKHLQT